MTKNLKAHLALLSANLIYGANYTIAKIALPEFVKPLGFILMRVTFAMLIFAFIQFTFIKEKVENKDILLLFFCAVFGIAVNQMMFFQGLSRTTEINASILMITTPILVIVFSYFILKEKITSKKILGVILGAIGAAMIILMGGSFSLGSDTLLGDLYIFINAASYGIYLVIAKPLMIKYHPFTILKWIFFFGFFMITPFGYEQFSQIDWGSFTTAAYLSVGYVLFFATFLAYLCNAIALNFASPSLVSAYIYSQPLIATIIAISFGKDSLTPVKIIAAILIFTGVYLVNNRPTKPKPTT